MIAKTLAPGNGIQDVPFIETGNPGGKGVPCIWWMRVNQKFSLKLTADALYQLR